MNTNQISNLSQSSVQPASPVSKPAPSAHTESTHAAVAGSSSVTVDQASLSSTSTLLAAALETPDVRTEKVASLQAAIATGTYHISSSDVAGKLLDSLLSK